MFGKDKNYLLAGYPPFIKNLLDDYQEEINWKGYNIDLVTGGEGVPLEWVYYVRKFLRPEAKIVSSYGASDIDIGIGFETPFCFFIRELVNQDEALRIRLFGKDDMPMIFQYNPLVHYIRETKNEQGKPEIEITLLDGKAASTKIKYNLHDEGKRYSYHEMIRTIEGYYPHFLSEFSKKGGNLQEILHLPFLCIFGRSDGTLSFDGANVFPDQIQSGILRKPALAKITNRFKMEKKYDHKHTTQFHIHIELKNKVTPKKNMELQFLTAILSELVKINPDFRESYNKNKTLSPIINLYTFEHSLFSKDDAKCKNIYSLLPPGKHKALMVKKKTKYKKT
jgi:phenylacetate-CoA ligase